MIAMPGNVYVCQDCLQKTFDTINNSGIVEFYYRGARENKNTVVFTDWYIMNNKKNESYNHVLNNYRFVQFKVKIKSSSTEVSIKDFIIKII